MATKAWSAVEKVGYWQLQLRLWALFIGKGPENHLWIDIADNQ
jgi:hypothetical protein